MRPVYQAFLGRRYEMIVLVCGAQMSKTELLFNVLGWHFAERHGPALYLGPTEKNVRSISRDRLTPMFEQTPVLSGILAGGQANKITEKYLAGSRLGLGWASSASELASYPARLVLLDERDRMSSDVADEGDPLALAVARTKNFPDATVAVTSTPTLEGASPIWSLWESGTMGLWAWRCPSCSELFVPRGELLVFDAEASLSEIERTAGIACPSCGVVHVDLNPRDANSTGAYLYHQAPGAEKPLEPVGPTLEPPPSATASFWISGLASPWVTLGKVARQLVTAQRSHEPEKIQAVTNTWLGELFRHSGERPAWEEVRACAADYDEAGPVPFEVQAVVAGVDVQRDRLYYVVRGFGHGLESWLLARGQLFGETEFDDVWIRLGRVLTQAFGDHRIARMLVDSGYRPGDQWRRPESIIHSFCRRYPGLAMPSKGFATLSAPVRETTLKREAIQLVTFDSDHFKTMLYGRLRWPPGEPGAWHVWRGIDEEYCRHLVAEEAVLTRGGQRQWLNFKRANHYLDCEVLALVAARHLSLELLPPLEDRLAAERRRAEAPSSSSPRRSSGQFSFHDT